MGEGSGRDYPRRERSSIDSFRSSSSTSTSTTTTQYLPLTRLVRALYRFHRSLPRLRLRFATNFEKRWWYISLPWIRILRNIYSDRCRVTFQRVVQIWRGNKKKKSNRRYFVDKAKVVAKLFSSPLPSFCIKRYVREANGMYVLKNSKKKRIALFQIRIHIRAYIISIISFRRKKIGRDLPYNIHIWRSIWI